MTTAPLPRPINLPPAPTITLRSGPAATQSPAAVRARSAVNVLVRLAFYLFVFSIPFEMPRRSIPIEIPTLTGCIFLLATFLQPTVVFRRIPGAVLWFITYLWVFGLSTLINRGEHTSLVIVQLLSHVQLLLILWAGANILRDKKTLRGTLLTFALATMIRAAMQIGGIAATVTPLWTGGFRTTVLGQNPNLSAIILSAGFITVLTMRPRLVAWSVAAIIGMALIQTGSRGGLLCAAGGVMVLLLQGKHRVRSILFGLVTLGLLGFAAWRSDMFRARLVAADRGSLAGRENIYPAVIEMISEKPWLGWGPAENQYEIGKRIGEERKDRRDAHNIVLEVLSATGIVGAIPFLAGIWLCFLGAWRARKGPLHMFPLAFLITVAIGTISGTWILSKILWLALAIALAAGAAAKEQRERTRAHACAV
ncbi:MAG TPA: O-antigen ligase [Gemmatimonadales bacterium]|nr:O-antigen ligase [Gemmatimonadales bacterium]